MIGAGIFRILITGLLFVILIPASLWAWKMESGTITLPATSAGSSTWQSVTLQQTYDTTPLIFVMPNEGSGYPADAPAAVRVRNITTTGFELVQVEPEGSDGPHPAMSPVHYVAIEAGDHLLPDGTQIAAGMHTTNHIVGNRASGTKVWDSVTFPVSFSSAPVVIGMVQTVANETNTLPGDFSAPWMVAAIRSVDQNGFETTLETVKTESNMTSAADEDIAYLAIQNSAEGSFFDTSSCASIGYETLSTPNVNNIGWDDQCYTVNFGQTYGAIPNVIGSMQTRNGGDGGWYRRCALDSESVGVTVDEDMSSGGNRGHPVGEVVGILVLEKDFVFDSSLNIGSCILAPKLEYRMDECYWLNENGGVFGDVKDSSANGFDATSSGGASLTSNSANPPLCNYGSFAVQPELVSAEDTTAGNTADGFSVSVWLRPSAMTEWQAIVTKSAAYNWDDGWGIIHFAGDANNVIRFFVNNFNNNNVSAALTLDTWNHVVATYDTQTLRLYVNGVMSASSAYGVPVVNSPDPLRIAYDDPGDDEYVGSVDELKFWDRVLTQTEINAIYTNERTGLNYTGSARECNTCGASIAANSWEMISIPAESRNVNLGVQDLFGDDFNGANYDLGVGGGWILWRRDHNANNNLHTYVKVDYSGNETVDFNKGYWLGSTLAVNWDTDGAQSVDYNSTYNGTADCPSARCVEIDLVAVVENGSRYNLSNFPGKSPVEWADCRFIISDPDGSNVEILTPEAAETAGYASKTIAFYAGGLGSGSEGQVISADYTECHDTTPGGCKIEPFHSAWIRLFTPTLNKKVKLLIPQE